MWSKLVATGKDFEKLNFETPICYCDINSGTIVSKTKKMFRSGVTQTYFGAYFGLLDFIISP